jgi:hypothetical protein
MPLETANGRSLILDRAHEAIGEELPIAKRHLHCRKCLGKLIPQVFAVSVAR